MRHILLLAIAMHLYAQTIHSSFSTYYENINFTNSKQKKDAVIIGVGADIHHNNSAYKFAYEHGETDTKKPPLKEDLKTDKLFLKYSYYFNKSVEINLNYIEILHDNIAITDKGRVYGAGVTYNFNKKIATNFTQFISDYEDFSAYESDFNINFKTKIEMLKINIKSITKYISLDDKNRNNFTKNANREYLTTGLKLHAHYSSYHLGVGAYFGKRIFAIMDDGFKIQHHAMEIDRTYAIGVGKSIYDFVFRVQYIYQRATEIPIKNRDVEVSNMRLIVNYKF